MTYVYEVKINPVTGKDEININMDKTNSREIFDMLIHYNSFYDMITISFYSNDSIIDSMTTDNINSLCYQDVANIFKKRYE